MRIGYFIGALIGGVIAVGLPVYLLYSFICLHWINPVETLLSRAIFGLIILWSLIRATQMTNEMVND